MFIAHLPAGYLLSRWRHFTPRQIPWVIAGAIAPDLDMGLFYLVHDGTVHHHLYLPHRPFVWVLVLILGLLLRRWPMSSALRALGCGGLLHMLLDTVVGQIAWGWPFTPHAVPLVDVPATQDWWVLSFVLHWTFVVELLICAVAICVWLRSRREKHP